ncbi:MAG: cyclic pyranopterin monophosphate synthase MoaC [Parvularculales bacterium]
MKKLSHIDEAGNAVMVNITDKLESMRQATAAGRIIMSSEALDMVLEGRARKGDVLGVARLAGIMAAKRTSDLIPLCHPLSLSGVTVNFTSNKEVSGIEVVACVKITGRTGVEMEALTAVSVACLTIYDMIKAIDRGAYIEELHVRHKSGGKSGEWYAPPDKL